MRIFLARHGQTEWNGQKRVQGHTDVHLDVVGKAQVEQLAESLRSQGIERIVSSDLRRAAESAEAVSKAVDVPVEYEPRLRERSYGEWEGFSYQEFSKEIAALAKKEKKPADLIAPPGGESFREMSARIKPVVHAIIGKNRSCLIVGHGGTCSLALCHLMKIPPEIDRKFRFDNACLTEVSFYRDGNRSLIRHNDGSHLTLSVGSEAARELF